jgi:membrane fusion protein (multidrug efflux system)
VAQPVNIKKGLRTASDVQIINGLEVGDTVITSGIMQLRLGTKVKLTIE